MKKRSLYLSIGLMIILASTLFGAPALLGTQHLINPYKITHDKFMGDVYNIYLGVIMMIGGIGLATSLWLHHSTDRPMRLGGRQYLLALPAMLSVGWCASTLMAWATRYKIIDQTDLGFYSWNAVWYMPPMLAVLITALVFKRHVIQGNSQLATWFRARTTFTVPARRSRPLPMAQGAPIG